MRRLAGLALIAAGFLASMSSGCSVSPAERAEIQRAWTERDAEMAAECRRNGVGFAAGGCIAGGP
jgi:hypothetical protein